MCDTEPETGDIERALDLLAATGPSIGRPLVDRVKSSRFHDMKELRPPSSGQSEIRMIFAFDPAREPIILVEDRER
ncbi:type II toxin-antitoxin system RelE/ParE family toxin [Kribbella sandramycini]|uniref:type II toxin-antitoxin system RelE/ParE family toxin n=1 Tax=Kribbella sandramycini TaxID=60450 RepID=UPI00192D9DED